MELEDEVFERLNKISIPGFFITIDVIHISSQRPLNMESFLYEKLEDIKNGASARKFAYKEGGWRMNFTFFPTDRVVDKKYALMNKVIKTDLQKRE